MIHDQPKTRILYNPSLKDITVDFDLTGPNPEHHILKAGEIKQFPPHIADLLEEKLVERELWRTPPANKNYEKRRKELKRVIRVDIET